MGALEAWEGRRAHDGRSGVERMSIDCAYAFAAVAAYELLAALPFLSSSDALLILFGVWALFFDGTHLFATYARTGLSARFRRQHAHLFCMTLVVFVAGPVCIAAADRVGGDASVRAATFGLNGFGIGWAYFHICRQHWGLLHEKRSRPAHHTRSRLQAAAATLAFGAPFAGALASAPELDPGTTLEPTAWWLYASVGAIATPAALLALSLLRHDDPLVRRLRSSLTGPCIVAAATLVVLSCRASLRALDPAVIAIALGAVTLTSGAVAVLSRASSEPRPERRPALALCVFTHAIVLLWPELPTGVRLVSLTLLHNVQYNRFVWRQGDSARVAPREPSDDLARRLSRSLLAWSAAAFGFSLLLLCVKAASLRIATADVPRAILFAFLWGFALHHYVLDGVIWKREPAKPPAARA